MRVWIFGQCERLTLRTGHPSSRTSRSKWSGTRYTAWFSCAMTRTLFRLAGVIMPGKRLLLFFAAVAAVLRFIGAMPLLDAWEPSRFMQLFIIPALFRPKKVHRGGPG